MSENISENLKQQSHWLRILFMIGFMVAIYVCGVILFVLVVVQALFMLLTGQDNENLRRLGANLTEYVNEILLFLTYNTDRRPFPMAPFPLVDESAGRSHEAAYGQAAADDAEESVAPVYPHMPSDEALKPEARSDQASDDMPRTEPEGDGGENPAPLKKKSTTERSTAKQSDTPDVDQQHHKNTDP